MLTEEEILILVDDADVEIGSEGKMQVHLQGLLHRAFSVFLWDDGGRLLLQRRAEVKYHSPGLWANTCCGHPRLGEDTATAAHRRLFEELGTRSQLLHHGTYAYRSHVGELVENEFVHLFSGRYSGTADPNPDEISELRWIEPADLIAEFEAAPHAFSAWFGHYIKDIPLQSLRPSPA
ncbi:MAG: isopentenyl-diphosphate Delta-isomerase [Novosphingobium sp.]